MTWSESWVQIPTLPLINWRQLPSWSFAKKVMNIPKIILKGNRWKWLKIVVVTVCTQKLLEQTFLKMTELWESHLQRPRGPARRAGSHAQHGVLAVTTVCHAFHSFWGSLFPSFHSGNYYSSCSMWTTDFLPILSWHWHETIQQYGVNNI